MRVWIDQDQCTGAGLCEDLAPEMIRILDDGLAYVLDRGQPVVGRSVPVSDGSEDGILEAADQCPTECIILETG